MLRDSHFRKLCAALGLDALADDQRFTTNADRLQHREELEAIVVPAFAARTFEEWRATLDTHGVLAGPVMKIPDIARDPALRAALPLVEVATETEVGSRAVGLPLRLGEGERRPSTPAAHRGEHTRAVLSELGFARDEIDDLVRSGVTPAVDGD